MAESARNGPISCELLWGVYTPGVLQLNGKRRETHKGAERGRGVPTEWGNPALAFLGAVVGVFSGYWEIVVVKEWGEAICFVLARLAVRARTSLTRVG